MSWDTHEQCPHCNDSLTACEHCDDLDEQVKADIRANDTPMFSDDGLFGVIAADMTGLEDAK